MANDKEKVLHIVMLPWLAFGHMIPNLELAKLIAGKGHRVSFVSTPRNIERLPKVSQNLATLIDFVKLPLPKVPNLPENAEATTDVPYDVVQYLKKAYDTLEEPFTHFLESSKADWLFYDFSPFWAASVASKLGIRKAFYSICTPPFLGFLGPPSVLMGHDSSYRQKPEDYIVAPPWVPFPTTVAFRYYEIMRIVDSLSSQNNSGVADTYRFGASIQNCDIVFIRGCTEFESEWFHLLESIYQKPVLPVGQLPSTAPVGSEDNDTWRWMKGWLDKQARGSVVYVAFGSEAKPTQDEVTEIALGLEKSKLPFLWLLRVQRGPYDPDVLRLPEGFEERIKGRGVVCSSWAPQLKILEHVAVGGFLTHSGWTSVVEAVQNEKPLVLLTFLADQGINARVLEEKKMGYSVPRDERDGSFSSDSVADSLKLVVVEEEGKIYRERIKEMKDLFVNGERQDRVSRAEEGFKGGDGGSGWRFASSGEAVVVVGVEEDEAFAEACGTKAICRGGGMAGLRRLGFGGEKAHTVNLRLLYFTNLWTSDHAVGKNRETWLSFSPCAKRKKFGFSGFPVSSLSFFYCCNIASEYVISLLL